MPRRSSHYRSVTQRRSVGRRRKSPETIFWIITITALVLTGAGFLLHNILFASDQRHNDTSALPVAVSLEEPAAYREWEPKTPTTHTSVLLLGLDNHGMSDVIMLLSYDMQTFDSSLISIMRDSFVHNQTWAAKDLGQDHLAWANYRGMGQDDDYHAGAKLAAATIEDFLGIDIHAYASISFEGFVSLVDLIGGVELEVAPEFANREGGPLPTGRQRLDGEQALIYARHRQNPRIAEPGSSSQDGDRVRRNQRLLKALLEQCKTIETDQLMAIMEELDDHLHTSMEDWDILDLANLLYNRDTEAIETVVLPGEGELVFQELIEQEVYYYFINFEESDLILQELGLK
jgi:polyisoprenyl-teichoic acid--peptidoglycan teichoic acid transferase